MECCNNTMLMTAESLPITLDVLDSRDGAIVKLPATLRQMYGEWATISLPASASVSCLRWGARVRFWMGEGGHGFEIIGAIVARDTTPKVIESEETAQKPGENSASGQSPASPHSDRELPLPDFHGEREFVLRLWECRPAAEQRDMPRRPVRFETEYLIHSDGSSGIDSTQNPGSAGNAGVLPVSQEAWRRGLCIDLGGGGMRLHISCLSVAPRRVTVRFILPARKTGATPAVPLCIEGKTLRYTVLNVHADCAEVALKFERLDPEEYSALNTFLTT